jgi:dethiobiotin synthetase
MGTGIFITGTDTGVGKTLTACGVAMLLREAGYRVGVMKPAETGCVDKDGALFPQDAHYLKEASGSTEPLARICPYRLRAPLAPSMAAAREGVEIDISALEAAYREISSAHDITLVEGAGGLLAPILPHYTYADLAKLLKLPVLVVAANRLGAINHLLLTLEHAACNGLHVLGYLFNSLAAEKSLAAETNREAMTCLTAIPCLGEIPYLSAPQPGQPPRETDRGLLVSFFAENLSFSFLEPLLKNK